MSGKDDRDGKKGGRDAAEPDAPVSDAEAGGAEATESGYRRDDYWREEARAGGVEPTDVPEPPQGYAFESPEQKAKADDADGTDETPGGKDGAGEDPDAEQGNAGGRDDARIVDD